MFFRRHVVRTVPLRPCTGGESCYNLIPTVHECQCCRFQKCIQTGMTILTLLQKTDFHKTIQTLSEWNYNRNITIFNCYPTDIDLNVSTIISGPVRYTPRAPYLDFQSWTYTSTVTTIDFMRKFPFLYFSKLQDQENLIKAYFVKVGSLCAAFRAYSEGNGFLTFPDGSDVLPPGVMSPDLEDLENRIRCRLVGQLIELQITMEEFLFMLVILITNPAIPNLSETGRILSSSYRNLYTSALFEYCMLTHQKYGPTRLTDLLSLSHVISKHYEDLNQYFVLLQLNNTVFQIKYIVREGLDLL
ncbi:hypothetical protein GCK72_019663 [Caenorhabditis remanei]|uniref:NR LBD domain-containing protein n=1 Tax=Caenorhabditis remanei TaxID=31234 RepID=A0A6A5GCX7_CAERE|nr:hypothetical protein GCK72_019663 [Caenorhabditis remanei]KAF1753107.1 hypothetical protein GCK72_019663 [Caenorhabditis remanei]